MEVFWEEAKVVFGFEEIEGKSSYEVTSIL